MGNARKFMSGFAMFLVALLSTGCLAGWLAPTVKNLPPEDYPKIPQALAQHNIQIMPQWIEGVVVQVRYTRSVGIRADDINLVKIRVYITNGVMEIIPCNPRQEESFVKDYAPGDVVAFHLPATYSRVTSTQDTVRLRREDMMMVEKGGVR